MRLIQFLNLGLDPIGLYQCTTHPLQHSLSHQAVFDMCVRDSVAFENTLNKKELESFNLLADVNERLEGVGYVKIEIETDVMTTHL